LNYMFSPGGSNPLNSLHSCNTWIFFYLFEFYFHNFHKYTFFS
jgi:hypothetical protein